VVLAIVPEPTGLGFVLATSMIAIGRRSRRR
jgi:hypothetical protein